MKTIKDNLGSEYVQVLIPLTITEEGEPMTPPDPKVYEPRPDLTPPPEYEEGTTLGHVVDGVSAYTVDGKVYTMRPEVQEKIAERKKAGKNKYGWEFPEE